MVDKRDCRSLPLKTPEIVRLLWMVTETVATAARDVWRRWWLQSIVADPGCLFRIPDPNFFHPGSYVFHPRSYVFHPRSRNRLGEFKYFNPKKWFLSNQNPDPGLKTRIILLTHPGSRGQKGTGSRIRNTAAETSQMDLEMAAAPVTARADGGIVTNVGIVNSCD